MSNNYVINALWNAASEAVKHRDLESLQEVISEIARHDCVLVEALENKVSLSICKDSRDLTSKPMPYFEIVERLDKEDAFRNFFEYVGNKAFRQSDFVAWMITNPHVEWMTKTHNFQSQLSNIFHLAVNKKLELHDHPVLKNLQKTNKHGYYVYKGESNIKSIFKY